MLNLLKNTLQKSITTCKDGANYLYRKYQFVRNFNKLTHLISEELAIQTRVEAEALLKAAHIEVKAFLFSLAAAVLGIGILYDIAIGLEYFLQSSGLLGALITSSAVVGTALVGTREFYYFAQSVARISGYIQILQNQNQDTFFNILSLTYKKVMQVHFNKKESLTNVKEETLTEHLNNGSTSQVYDKLIKSTHLPLNELLAAESALQKIIVGGRIEGPLDDKRSIFHILRNNGSFMEFPLFGKVIVNDAITSEVKNTITSQSTKFTSAINFHKTKPQREAADRKIVDVFLENIFPATEKYFLRDLKGIIFSYYQENSLPNELQDLRLQEIQQMITAKQKEEEVCIARV